MLHTFLQETRIASCDKIAIHKRILHDQRALISSINFSFISESIVYNQNIFSLTPFRTNIRQVITILSPIHTKQFKRKSKMALAQRDIFLDHWFSLFVHASLTFPSLFLSIYYNRFFCSHNVSPYAVSRVSVRTNICNLTIQ